MKKRANLNFRKVRLEQRKELVQEVLANCLVAFDRLVRLGKVDLVYPSALARYAMEGLGSKLLIREYLTALPKESALAAEVARTRELLERQAELRQTGHGKSS